jgi:hypothetical protein
MLSVIGDAIAVAMRERLIEQPRADEVTPSRVPAPPPQITPPSEQAALAHVLQGGQSSSMYESLLAAMGEWESQLPVSQIVQGDVKLDVEIQEVLFRQTGSLLMSNDLIILRLSVTNHGHDEPAAREWNLTVKIGRDKKDAKTTKRLPSNLLLRRKLEYGTTADESLAPDLVEMCQTDGFKRGVPKIGWIAFEMYAPSGAIPPYHAALAVTITDSFKNRHVGRLEPTRYTPPGEIHAIQAS